MLILKRKILILFPIDQGFTYEKKFAFIYRSPVSGARDHI